MPNLPGFTAKVICDGKPLSEYNVEHPDSDPTRSVCWIASTAGKTFRIDCSWNVEDDEDLDFVLQLRCDGAIMCGPYVQHSKGQFSIKHANVIGEDGIHHRKEMKFAHVELMEDSSEFPDALPTVGVIELNILRAKWTYVQTRGSSHSRPSRATQTTRKIAPLPERKKFLGAHRVVFGNDLGSGRHSNTTRLDKTYTAREPCYSFKFNYRSKEVLVAQDVIPPSPSPYRQPRVILSAEREAGPKDESDEEDIDVIAAKIHVLNQTIARLQSRKRKRSTRESPFLVDEDEVIEISSD